MWFLPSGDTFCLENMPNIASGLASLGMNRKIYQSNAMDRASNHSLGVKMAPDNQVTVCGKADRRESGCVFLLQDRQESIPWLWGRSPWRTPSIPGASDVSPHQNHKFSQPRLKPKSQIQPSIKRLRWNKIKCRQGCAPKATQTASLLVPICGRQADSESRVAETQQYLGTPWGRGTR
jgi:hypothetical protein